MSEETHKIELLLKEISGKIELNEALLDNKQTKTEYLLDIQAREEKIYTSIRNLDKRLNSLYVKVAIISGAVGIIAGLITRFVIV